MAEDRLFMSLDIGHVRTQCLDAARKAVAELTGPQLVAGAASSSRRRSWGIRCHARLPWIPPATGVAISRVDRGAAGTGHDAHSAAP